MKLNDLIPEIQELVSQRKLGTTAAEQLAHLTKEEQRELFAFKGVEVGSTTVKEAQVASE